MVAARGGASCSGVGVQTPWLRGLSQGLDCASPGQDFAKPIAVGKKFVHGDFYIQGKYPVFKAECVCVCVCVNKDIFRKYKPRELAFTPKTPGSAILKPQ